MRYAYLLLVVAAVIWGGCSKSLEVALTGTPGMNNGGNAAVVKVYQLKGTGSFKQVPASTFWRNDTKALGGELLTEPKEVTLYPSDSTTFQIKLAEKTKYIGVAANLRDPQREKWRTSHSVKDMGNRVRVTIEDRTVAVRFEEKGFMSKALNIF